MIGPQGVRGPETGYDPAKVSSVEGSTTGVRVVIAVPEEVFFTAAHWLTVRCNFSLRDNTPDVHIYGGNTNDGGVERYEVARDAYRDAIAVAKFMQQFIEDPDGDLGTFHDHDGDDILDGLVLGLPDWTLCIYLALAGEEFDYGRDYEPNPDFPRIYSLDRLRERVAEIARARATATA